MTDFYCDISAVGNEYQAYAATPTWGALSTDKPLPMDGTGLAGPGHSAAVAIAEFQITVLPADTNTIAIAGATLTAKTTAAAKNQWTIGADIATCITNLVALLNTYGTGTAQCDAATATGACKLLLALPYWQFARVKPGTTDTIQIATRFAGADLNYASNSNVGITSAGWATPPTITQFAGGANGPFAYLVSTNTLFGKAKTLYGLFLAVAGSVTDPTASDVVHVRTMRSSVSLSYVFSVSAEHVNTSYWKNRSYLFDDGTVWSGDNGTLAFTLEHTGTGGWNIAFLPPANMDLSFVSRSKYNFEVLINVPNGGPSIQFMGLVSTPIRVVFLRSKYTEHVSSYPGGPFRWISFTSNLFAGVSHDLSESHFTFRGNPSATRTIYTHQQALNNMTLMLNGLTVDVVGATAPIGPLFNIGVAATPLQITWHGGYVKDTNGVYSCETPFSLNTGALYAQASIDNVEGVTNPAAGFTASEFAQSNLWWNQSEGSARGFRHETSKMMVDWRSGGTFPHCGAVNMQGDAWSHRVTWGVGVFRSAPVVPFRSSFFHRGTPAALTLTLELYTPDASTIYKDEIRLDVSYKDSGGVLRRESTGEARLLQLAASRNALTTSAKSWTSNGVGAHSAKKIVLTTAYSVGTDSDVTATVVLASSRSPAVAIYVSPELGVA